MPGPGAGGWSRASQTNRLGTPGSEARGARVAPPNRCFRVRCARLTTAFGPKDELNPQAGAFRRA